MSKLKGPSSQTVAIEIAKLENMKPKIRRYSMFEDDNWAAIEAQIEVLENFYDEDDVYNKAEDSDGDWPQYTVDSAINAVAWLEGDEATPPSEEWVHLLVN